MSLRNKVFASGQAIREACLTVLRPTVHGSESSRTQKHSLCGFAASSGVLNPQENKKNIITMICVVCIVIGGITRVMYCLKYPVPVRDSFKYERIIQQWNNSGVFPESAYVPPLGLYINRLPSYLFGCEIMKGGRAVNVLMGILIIIMSIYIANEITCKKNVSLLVGLIVSTNPSFVEYSCQMLRENAYIFFCCLSVYYVIKFLKKKQDYTIIIVSSLSAAAYLCRHEGLELFVINLLIILLVSNHCLRRKIQLLSLYIAIYLISGVAIIYLIDVPIHYFKTYHDVFSRPALLK